jgi:hypothetical protein
MPFQVKDAPRWPNKHDQNRTSPGYTGLTISTEKNERILKGMREKKQITYKGKPIKTTADFSTKMKHEWHGVRYFKNWKKII